MNNPNEFFLNLCLKIVSLLHLNIILQLGTSKSIKIQNACLTDVQIKPCEMNVNTDINIKPCKKAHIYKTM